MTSPRLVFAGTPDFALASLQAMVGAGFRPQAVYTQPDRPSGRGRRLTASPVKTYAIDQGIPVYQPASLKDPDAVEQLAKIEPDLLIVAAYGLLLPQSVLDIPKRGCVNVHASLLPRWRGAAPIQAAIAAGDTETGICLMRMEAGLDTGPVFVRAAVPIGDDATAGSVHDELASLGGRLLASHLAEILAGDVQAEPQDDSQATYAPKIRPEDARIDWTSPAAAVHRRIRAYNPVPGARFAIDDEYIKVWRAAPGRSGSFTAGKVISASRDGIEVGCGESSIFLTELQRPGRRRVSAAEFAAQIDLAGRMLG